MDSPAGRRTVGSRASTRSAGTASDHFVVHSSFGCNSAVSNHVVRIYDHVVLFFVGCRLVTYDADQHKFSLLPMGAEVENVHAIAVSNCRTMLAVAVTGASKKVATALLFHLSRTGIHRSNRAITYEGTATRGQKKRFTSLVFAKKKSGDLVLGAHVSSPDCAMVFYDALLATEVFRLELGMPVTSFTTSPLDHEKICTTGPSLFRFWHMQHRTAHAAPLNKLTYPNGVYTCHCWVDKTRIAAGLEEGHVVFVEGVQEVQVFRNAHGKLNVKEISKRGNSVFSVSQLGVVCVFQEKTIALKGGHTHVCFEWTKRLQLDCAQELLRTVWMIDAPTNLSVMAVTKSTMLMYDLYLSDVDLDKLEILPQDILSIELPPEHAENGMRGSQLLELEQMRKGLASSNQEDDEEGSVSVAAAEAKGVAAASLASSDPPLPAPRGLGAAVACVIVDGLTDGPPLKKLRSQSMVMEFPGDRVTGLASCSRLPLLLTCCSRPNSDCSIRAFNFASQKQELVVRSDHQGVEVTASDIPTCIALHPTGRLVAVGYEDEARVMLLTSSNCTTAHRLKVKIAVEVSGSAVTNTAPVSFVRFSNAGHLVAVASGKMVQIFHLYQLNHLGQPRREMVITGHATQVIGVVFSEDDLNVWTASSEAVYEWEIGQPHRVADCVNKAYRINNIVYCGHGRLAASATKVVKRHVPLELQTQQGLSHARKRQQQQKQQHHGNGAGADVNQSVAAAASAVAAALSGGSGEGGAAGGSSGQDSRGDGNHVVVPLRNIPKGRSFGRSQSFGADMLSSGRRDDDGKDSDQAGGQPNGGNSSGRRAEEEVHQRRHSVAARPQAANIQNAPPEEAELHVLMYWDTGLHVPPRIIRSPEEITSLAMRFASPLRLSRYGSYEDNNSLEGALAGLGNAEDGPLPAIGREPLPSILVVGTAKGRVIAYAWPPVEGTSAAGSSGPPLSPSVSRGSRRRPGRLDNDDQATSLPPDGSSYDGGGSNSSAAGEADSKGVAVGVNLRVHATRKARRQQVALQDSLSLVQSATQAAGMADADGTAAIENPISPLWKTKLHNSAVLHLDTSTNGLWIYTAGADGCCFVVCTNRAWLEREESIPELRLPDHGAVLVDWAGLRAHQQVVSELEARTADLQTTLDRELRHKQNDIDEVQMRWKGKMEEELGKKEEALVNVRAELARQVEQFHKRELATEDDNQRNMRELETVYEKKMTAAAARSMDMQQAYDEVMAAAKLDMEESQNALAQRQRDMTDKGESQVRQMYEERKIVLEYMDFLRARYEEVLQQMETTHDSEVMKLRGELHTKHNEIAKIREATRTEITLMRRQVALLKEEIRTRDASSIEAKQKMEKLHNRSEELESSLKETLSALRDKAALVDKWETSAGSQQRQISELEGIRCTLTNQLHELRAAYAPKAAQLMNTSERLETLDREYGELIEKMTEKESASQLHQQHSQQLVSENRQLRSQMTEQDLFVKQLAVQVERLAVSTTDSGKWREGLESLRRQILPWVRNREQDPSLDAKLQQEQNRRIHHMVAHVEAIQNATKQKERVLALKYNNRLAENRALVAQLNDARHARTTSANEVRQLRSQLRVQERLLVSGNANRATAPDLNQTARSESPSDRHGTGRRSMRSDEFALSARQGSDLGTPGSSAPGTGRRSFSDAGHFDRRSLSVPDGVAVDLRSSTAAAAAGPTSPMGTASGPRPQSMSAAMLPPVDRVSS